MSIFANSVVKKTNHWCHNLARCFCMFHWHWLWAVSIIKMNKIENKFLKIWFNFFQWRNTNKIRNYLFVEKMFSEIAFAKYTNIFFFLTLTIKEKIQSYTKRLQMIIVTVVNYNKI